MRKKLLILFCGILTVALLFSNVLIASADEFDYYGKQDEELIEKLEEQPEDSNVPVTVSFACINYAEAEEKTIDKLQNVVSDEILDIAYGDGNKTSLSKAQAEKQINTVVKTENKVITDMIKENNENSYEELFPTSKPKIISTGTSVSVMNMYLNKRQIDTISKSDLVTQVSYYNAQSQKPEPKVPVLVSKKPYLVQVPHNLKAGNVWNIKVNNADKAIWSSSNNKIARVQNGKVTALNKGKVNITAKISNTYTLKCMLNVVNSPTVNRTTVNVKKGKSTYICINGKAKSINNKYTNSKYAKVISKANATKVYIKGIKKGVSFVRVKINDTKLISVKVKVV